MPVELQIGFAVAGLLLQAVTIGIMLYFGKAITSKITNITFGDRNTNIAHADRVEFRESDS